MSETNEIDMTCAVCGGTFEFPEGADCYDNRVCRDSCHDPDEWKKLAVLVDALEMASTFGQQAQYQSALTRIAEHFGDSIIMADGSLHRQALRGIVFSDALEKDWLENLLHPLIAELMKSRISSCASPYFLLVSPLLLETGQQQLADRILVVDVSKATQLTRTLQRDRGDPDTINAIIASQIDRQQRLQKADDILDNEAGLDRLNAGIHQLHQKYLRLAEESRESK